MYQILLKTVHKNLSCVRFYVWCEEEEKYEKNLPSFRVSYLRNGWGYSFQIWYVCKVLYMKALKYVELVEIGAVVF